MPRAVARVTFVNDDDHLTPASPSSNGSLRTAHRHVVGWRSPGVEEDGPWRTWPLARPCARRTASHHAAQALRAGDGDRSRCRNCWRTRRDADDHRPERPEDDPGAVGGRRVAHTPRSRCLSTRPGAHAGTASGTGTCSKRRAQRDTRTALTPAAGRRPRRTRPRRGPRWPPLGVFTTQIDFLNVPVALSNDLREWSAPVDALPELPVWAE